MAGGVQIKNTIVDMMAKKIAPWLMMIFLVLGVIIFVFSIGQEGVSDSDDASGGKSTWAGSINTIETITFTKNNKKYTAKMPATAGKIGHEQHAANQNCFKNGNSHYNGLLSFYSKIGSVKNCMAFGSPRTTEQEEWYFNMRWDTSGNYPTNVEHLKVIITNPKNNKKIVASIEEYGPAAFLMARDGINAGASPEVYKYLELSNPYTNNPNDKSGYAEFSFAEDQNIPLGPLN